MKRQGERNFEKKLSFLFIDNIVFYSKKYWWQADA